VADRNSGSVSAPPVVFVDADNTLWDTDGVFAKAQLRLLDAVESASSTTAPTDRLDFVRRIDQALAERHHLGLRYPPRLLALALAWALAGDDPEAAAKAVWKEAGAPGLLSNEQTSAVEAQFFTDAQAQPAVFPGVEAGLQRLHASGALILVLTEGDRRRVLRTASEHGIVGLFDRVIESPKTARLFERVLRLTGRPQRAFMIGDQLQRDIAPAKAAGLTTIYVPGRFRPRWEPNEEVVGPSHRVERFDQAADIILQPR
jgi:putative hydrolase of the HAD superfamily